MTPEQFVYWFQGYLEIGQPTNLNERDIKVIKDHLDLVFNKVIPRQPLVPTAFAQRSYVWIRQNIDSGTGELRVKNLKLYVI